MGTSLGLVGPEMFGGGSFAALFKSHPAEVRNAVKAAMHQDKTPADLRNMDFVPGGHGGSHPCLVHEFVEAIAHNRQAAINIREAVR
ncbi:MAG: hypothetical protein FJ225_01240 [Lentisphaerae bacterium]|nr:hypothetical protein [Lentisphaerota bacterium]